MKHAGKFAVLGIALAALSPMAFADEIDLSGPGSFNGGVYTPGVANPPASQYDVTVATGIFMTFANATPVFYAFNDTTVPAGNLFSVENPGGTEDLTFQATSENIINSLDIVFGGELYENGMPLTTATMGFSENPLNTSNQEDSITIAATPEPSSVALLGTGLLGVAGLMRRRMLRA